MEIPTGVDEVGSLEAASQEREEEKREEEGEDRSAVRGREYT